MWLYCRKPHKHYTRVDYGNKVHRIMHNLCLLMQTVFAVKDTLTVSTDANKVTQGNTK